LLVSVFFVVETTKKVIHDKGLKTIRAKLPNFALNLKTTLGVGQTKNKCTLGVYHRGGRGGGKDGTLKSK
jgi:hypothetical protein